VINPITKLPQLLGRWSYQPPFRVDLQSDESECGLACLSMLLSAKGLPVTLEAVRQDYGSTRGGTTIGNLCSFAERHGFRAIPARKAQPEAKNLPCIIFVRGEHFSVLWSMQGDYYAVADPSDGCLLLNEEQFNAYYSGVSLSLRPIPNRIGTSPLLGQTQREEAPKLLPITREVLIPVLLLAVVISVLTLATASFQDVFMTYVVEEGDLLWTRGLINLTLGFAVVLAATTFVLQLILQRFLQINIFNWNLRIFASLFDAPYSFFVNKTSGLITSRLNQVDEALSGFQSAALTALMGSLNLLIFLVAVTVVSWPLALVSFVGMCGFMVVGIKFYGFNLQANYLQRQAECTANSSEFKLISGRDQVILEKCQTAMIRELASSYVGQSIAELKINRYGGWNEFFLSSIDLLLNALLLVVSAILIIKGYLTTGTYAAVNVIIGTALQPIRSLAQTIEILQSAKLSFSTANELLQDKLKQSDISLAPQANAALLEVGNVSFQYSRYSEKVLDGFHLRLSSTNEKPVIVRMDGQTGAGKTSFFNLILGLHKPTEGYIRIRGLDISDVGNAQRNQLVQFVDRNPFILNESVLGNTLLGTSANEQDLHDCLESLGLSGEPLFREQAHRYLPDASAVSTGQAVMIALLRAVLMRPQLLLIDEALSSLPEDQHLPILRGLQKLGINVILVQHGTSPVLSALPTFQLAELQHR
jgi:ABC-type bacteriocin/lantibiotic exporter with double-glycine peptidase domain